MFESIKRAFASWMQGRYGIDELSKVVFGISIVLFLISTITSAPILPYIALMFALFLLFRCYSKNHAARTKELEAYRKIVNKPKAWVSLTIKRITNRKTTRYFKCESCKTVCSVPKGKGKIRVTCPKCRTQTIRKS